MIVLKIVDESFVQGVFSAKLRRPILEDINFTYKRMRSKDVGSFLYLGALLDWKQTAESAWADRKYGVQGIWSSGRLLLPRSFLAVFSRQKKNVYTTVGGADLFGAEFWASFIPLAGRAPGTRVSRDVLAWILRLGSARLIRCSGWMELRELHGMATGMALRAIEDAICHRGLLRKAILQLQRTFENAGRKACMTWMGRLVHVVRVYLG